MEMAVLNNIAFNDYNNGSEDDPTWAFCATEETSEFTEKELRGAFSSCIKKGLAGFQKEPNDESLVWITFKGEEIVPNLRS